MTKKKSLVGKIVLIEYWDHAGTWDEVTWGQMLESEIPLCCITGIVIKDTKLGLLVCSEWSGNMMRLEDPEEGIIWNGICGYGWVVKGAIKKVNVLGEMDIDTYVRESKN